MNTRKIEGRTVVRWMALAIQVLIVLKGVEGQQTTSLSSVSLSVSSSLLTSSSAVQATTTEATATSSSPLSGQTRTTTTPSYYLSGQTMATTTTRLFLSFPTVQSSVPSTHKVPMSSSLSKSVSSSASVSSSLLTSSSAVQSTKTEATATPSSSLSGQTSTTTTPSYYLSGQTMATTTTRLFSSFPTVQSSVPSTDKVPMSSSLSKSVSSSASVSSSLLTSSSAVQSTTTEATATPSSSLSGQTPTTTTPSYSLSGQTTATTTTTPLFSSSPTVQSSVPSTDKVPMSSSPSKSVSSSASSTASPSSSPNVENATVTPSKYIQMSLSMPWGRFCYLTTLFKESLSRDLIEFKGLQYQHMPLDRIQFYDVDKKCKNRTLYHSKKAIVKFFISKTEQFVSKDDTDERLTIKAFKLLYGYWVNQRMILLDKTFEGKVRKVELINGTDNEDITSKYVDKYTEAQRIGIAIGVALAIVVLILIIIFGLKGRHAIRSFGREPEDDNVFFSNVHALEESPTNESGNASQPLESQAQPRDEPEEVVVNAQPSPLPIKNSEPVVQAQDEIPLLSAIKDYEDGKKADETKTDKEPGEEVAPLAKPEPEEVSEEEPTKPPRSDSLIVVDTATPEETPPTSETPVTEEPAKTEDQPDKTEDEPDEPEEEGLRERRPTFTSSVTINITPEPSTASKGFNYPVTVQLPALEKDDNEQGPASADEVSGKEDEKPDFGQSDNSDADPDQGAINLGFDFKDEASKEETEKEEETKF